jgi:hypothetical protein
LGRQSIYQLCFTRQRYHRGIVLGPFNDYPVAGYDEGLQPGRIRVILEVHRFNMQKGIYSDHSIKERKIKELQPIRILAWRLHGDATKEPSHVDPEGLRSMHALQCRGYIDRSAESYAILVYHLPVSAAQCGKMMTLRDLSHQSPSPILTNRNHRISSSHHLVPVISRHTLSRSHYSVYTARRGFIGTYSQS